MLAHVRAGKGSTVVFLHGFCEWKGYWLPAVDVLSASFECICIDLPGHGNSPVMPNITMEDMAKEVVDTLTKLHIYDFTLVGHSMGGYVALAIAEQFPEKVKGLCLCNSTAMPDSEEKKQQRNKTIDYLRENGVKAFIKPFVPPLFHPENRDACADIIEAITERGLKLKNEAIAAATIAMRNRPDRTHVLKQINVPVLFIIGKNDTAVKFEDIMPQVSMPRHTYIQINEPCGHQSLYECKHESIKMIESFAFISNGNNA